MSLGQALTAAMDGLSVTQSGMALVAANVANSGTAGYTEKTQAQETITSGGFNVGVDVASVNRQLNTFLQSQLRTETSGGSYADLTTQIYQQLQQGFGDPQSSTSLSATYSNFTGAIQSLASSPADYSTQSTAISAGQALASQLNSLSTSVQQLRSSAEQGLSDSVTSVNNLLKDIANINSQVQSTPTLNASTASLLDQRDEDVSQLSQYMDINVMPSGTNGINVLTSSGVQLVGNTASTLTFNSHGTLSPSSLWNADPTKSGTGTITLTSPTGGSIDLIATNAIRSGKIGAYLQMRDKILPQAQAQIDQIAASVSSALSDYTTAGTAVTSGGQNGFTVDVGKLLAGNTVKINYTTVPGNTTKTLTVEQVSDPSSLPLPSPDPNNPVVGVNFSGGMANAISQLNGILGSKLQFSNPTGTVLQVLNGGAGTGVTINSVTSTATQTSLTGGTTQLPFFTDGSTPYSGAVTGGVSQTVGYASRIQVNPALVNTPTNLVTYQASTQSGDPTRPDFLSSQLTSATYTFPAQAGIGTASAPYNGTITNYLGQVLSTQGAAAAAATSLSAGQDVVVNSLQQSFNTSSGVNVDTEMARLLTLQNAYSANARVLTTINAMFTTLYQASAA